MVNTAQSLPITSTPTSPVLRGKSPWPTPCFLYGHLRAAEAVEASRTGAAAPSSTTTSATTRVGLAVAAPVSPSNLLRTDAERRIWRIRGLLDRVPRALPSCWRGGSNVSTNGATWAIVRGHVPRNPSDNSGRYLQWRSVGERGQRK